MGALEGKIAIVTGGNSGIGLATAKRFVEEGAYVFITARRQSELDKAIAEIGRNVRAIAADLAKLENIATIAETVSADKGVVDIVVLNAGFTERSPIEDITPEHFDKAFNLMARAPVFLVQATNRSYARTWAAEFKDRGIRANTLSPGLTDTPILDGQAEGMDRQEVIKGYVSAIPLGRAADAVEIANAAVFLGSDQSSYVTGADLMVDGGIGQV